MLFSEISGQKRTVKILQGVLKTRRIPHAYLFSEGNEAVKELAARTFAQALNCEKKALEPCEKCQSCQKTEKDVHPDLITIGPDGASLKIDQIRELKELTRYGPSESQWQVCLIKGSEQMTLEAANSFLKLLEEPPPQVVFILLTAASEAIPATILSRCQKILFSELPERNLEDNLEEIKWEGLEPSALKGKGISALLGLSQRLSENKDETKDMLEQLINFYWSRKLVEPTRIALDTLKSVKKHANLRLALDVMYLKLGGMLHA